MPLDCESERGIRLLTREVFLAKDGVIMCRGNTGLIAPSLQIRGSSSDYCSRERLCYFAITATVERDSVDFSTADLNSHVRGYPALLDITNGGPAGALVFARNAVAGSIWTRNGVLVGKFHSNWVKHSATLSISPECSARTQSNI